MALAQQWDEIEQGLPEGWGDARLRLRVADGASAERAAALLGPLGPWRSGADIRFFAARGRSGPSADVVRRALRRLDDEGIAGALDHLASDRAPDAPQIERTTLAEEWDAVLATLPPDWSDLYAEVELDSSDWIMRASVNMVPLNARRTGGKPALRFRAARRFGYGAAPEMVRRCLERCDADGIEGAVRVLRVLSGTYPVQTQGPVWLLGGRTI